MVLPDFEAWAIFASVAEHGSFNGAARALNLSTATISKAVSRLEASIGTMLFSRTSRRIALTETGAQLAERAARLLADAIDTEECAREEVGAARGTVKLAVPMSFGIGAIGPIIADFLSAFPGIAVEMHLSDAQVDLVGDGYDAALRIGTLPDSSLRARKLRSVSRLVVASPDWRDRHPELGVPADLNPRDVFGYTNLPRTRQIILCHPDGREAAFAAEGRLRANNADAMLAAVEAGHGVTLAPDFIVRPALEAGRLVTILDAWSAPPVALYLVTPPGRLRPRRVTALLDFLEARLAG